MFNLWMFLTFAIVFGVFFLTVVVFTAHKKKLKELELEALKIEKSDSDTVIKEKLANQLNRIEVLEAIVTDKGYDLGDKITSL